MKTETKRMWVCYYINSRGNECQKIFDSLETGLRFVETLDRRIEKGTCGGYSFSELPRMKDGGKAI